MSTVSVDKYAGKAAIELARQINKSFMNLYAKFMMDGAINYKGIRNSKDFQDYQELTASLEWIDLGALSRDELLAFSLTIYNALVIHGMITSSSPVDLSQAESRRQFFQGTCYSIGGFEFSLDDIEHGLLRCNAVHPSSGLKFFPDGDPRAKLVLQRLDPRIHFALVCGAKSCPPVRAYSLNNLENGLQGAANVFCLNNIAVDVDKREITLPKLFDWYRHDFGHDENSMMMSILSYMKPKDDSKPPHDHYLQVKSLVESGVSYTLRFTDYDWSINGAL